MNLISRLQIVSDAYCEAVALRREQISYRLFADQRRLGDVFSDRRGMTVASFEKAMLWFASNWPEGLDWPEGVERPELVEAVDSGAAPLAQGAAA